MTDLAKEIAASRVKRGARARAVIARTAAAHMVDVKALAGQHPARQKHHVAMARCNAAWTLREEGYRWAEIAGHLGMKGHSLAVRSANRWADLLKQREARGHD